MKRFWLIGISLIGLISCREVEYGDPTKYTKKGETLLYCESQYNVPSKILFYESSQITNVEENVAGRYFLSYYITDVHGKTYSINMHEIENFVCEEIQ